VSAVRALAEEPHWSLYTNFHFGHMEGGYAWCSGAIEVERYLDLWQEKIADTNAVNRDEWDSYWGTRTGIGSSEKGSPRRAIGPSSTGTSLRPTEKPQRRDQG